MLQRSSFRVFLIRLVLAYVLLLAPWPGFNDAYGLYFRTLGKTVLSAEGERRVVTFEAPDKDFPHPHDTRVVIVNLERMNPDGSGPIRYLHFNARRLGWSPLALLIALILATPISWERRLGSLLFGTLLIHGFMLAALGIAIWNESTEIGLVTLSPFWKAVASGCKETLTTQISLVIPVLVWILVTFRREDMPGLSALFQKDKQTT